MALHIMVVEDEPAIRQELCQLLSNALYQVSAVEDFTDVAQTILDKEPNLVLLDLIFRWSPVMISVRKSGNVRTFRLFFSPAAPILWMN